MKSAYAIQQLIESELVVARRRHPELVTAMERMVRTGRLVPVLPGVLAPPERRDELHTRLAAVAQWDHDAVVLGRAAAQQTFWPKLAVSTVEVAARGRGPASRGFVFRQRVIAPEHVLTRGELRLTVPALTALDLTDELAAKPIDRLLFSGRATLSDLRVVLAETEQRPGNLVRRQLLLDSRDKPWSHAERMAHRELRAAGITGWQANYPLQLLGTVYFVDIAFERARLAIEIDGREFHTDDTFDYDRWRQNDIVFDGWHLLRFPAETVINHGGIFVNQVCRALEQWG